MILNNKQMIVKNALKHSVLGMLGARKSGLVFWETLTIVSQSKKHFRRAPDAGNENQSIGPQNQGVNKCFV
jgi:hypothetical protein